jgi:hypothetical protein
VNIVVFTPAALAGLVLVWRAFRVVRAG